MGTNGTVAQVDPATEAAKEGLAKYLADTGRSQAEVAASMDVSASALSQWRRGNYAGDNAAIATKVDAFLQVEKKRSVVSPATRTFRQTSIGDDVLRVCDFAHVHRVVGVVNGEAGMGKTMALREYCRQHPETVFIRCNPSFKTPKALLEAVLNALGRNPRGLNALNRLVDDAVDALSGTRRLLVLDEAQFLTKDTLEVVRTIHDEAGIPVVLSGNYDLYNRMTGKSASLWAQVFSRVGIQREIGRTATLEDVGNLVGDLGRGCVEFLHARSREPGGLRRMGMVFEMGAELARREAQALSVDHLNLAVSLLMGGRS